MKGKVSQFCAVVTEDKPIIYFSITNQPPKDQWSGFPGGSAVKNLPANAGDTGSSPGLEDPTYCGAAELTQHSY